MSAVNRGMILMGPPQPLIVNVIAISDKHHDGADMISASRFLSCLYCSECSLRIRRICPCDGAARETETICE